MKKVLLSIMAIAVIALLVACAEDKAKGVNKDNEQLSPPGETEAETPTPEESASPEPSASPRPTQTPLITCKGDTQSSYREEWNGYTCIQYLNIEGKAPAETKFEPECNGDNLIGYYCASDGKCKKKEYPRSIMDGTPMTEYLNCGDKKCTTYTDSNGIVIGYCEKVKYTCKGDKSMSFNKNWNGETCFQTVINDKGQAAETKLQPQCDGNKLIAYYCDLDGKCKEKLHQTFNAHEFTLDCKEKKCTTYTDTNNNVNGYCAEVKPSPTPTPEASPSASVTPEPSVSETPTA